MGGVLYCLPVDRDISSQLKLTCRKTKAIFLACEEGHITWTVHSYYSLIYSSVLPQKPLYTIYMVNVNHFVSCLFIIN